MPPSTFAGRFALASLLSLLFFVRVPCRAAQKPQELDSNLPDTDVPYGISDWSESLGNHRARVSVNEHANAVWVRIPWRRRDEQPGNKEILVVDAATNLRVTNVARVSINRELGDLLFAPPTVPGEYFIYYLPFTREGWWASPTTVYWTPTNTADAVWLATTVPLQKQILHDETNGLPAAKVLAIEAINDFNRRDPMEVVATAHELKNLLAEHARERYLLFPEDRRYPIRMTEELPLRWIRRGPSSAFAGEALRGEFYAFQLGLFACSQPVNDVRIEFSDLRAGAAGTIPAAALRCFNLRGTNWLGQPIQKTVNVPKGKVQALWLGVQVPLGTKPATYRGKITVRPGNAPASTVRFALAVSASLLPDAGDGELWRQSRLRWLDSTIGLDDEVFAPYTPVTVRGQTVGVLGRQVRFNDAGLLDSIQTTFSGSVDATDARPLELLANPMQFIVETAAGPVHWKLKGAKALSHTTEAVVWQASAQSDGLELLCRAKLECDGYINYQLTLRASRRADLKDIRLEIPLRREVATYMMGLGRKGGYRPAEWQWKWDVNRANSQLWIGDVNAGLSCKLKHLADRWDIYNLVQSGLYRDWSNEGKGGCNVTEEGAAVVIRAYTGLRAVVPKEELHFNFGLLITPVKTLDKHHWQWRYYHAEQAKPVSEVAPMGISLINLHQGDPFNPHINYPFAATAQLSNYIAQAHARDIKVKIYYTIRELSNYAAEFWALRSLGNEVFLDGPGFKLADQFVTKPPSADKPKTGGAWLCEHAISGYVPAWHTPLGNGHYDASIATTGLSRWHNYYLEGLGWLIRNVGVDGLYLDGVGYDREILKRVRKVMQQARPGCLIDFHSGNNFHPEYGLNNCANQYIELFPCLDSLWLGEGFDYNESPDYWLVEIAGIPYGLFSEMLQGGGNPWRGMLYGMSNRLGWGGDPRPLWKAWDDFQIQDARMLGYWDAANPVKTGETNILATTYLKNNQALISLASWAKGPTQVRLALDPAKLGFALENARFSAPAIPGFQGAATFKLRDPIPVDPGRGWLLLLKP